MTASALPRVVILAAISATIEEKPSQARRMPSIGSYSAAQWIGPLGGAVTPLGAAMGLRAIYLCSSLVKYLGIFAPSGYEGTANEPEDNTSMVESNIKSLLSIEQVSPNSN
jgi:hypothetical protein